MTLGVAPRQPDLLCTTVRFCEGCRVAPESIYGVLHRECFSLFPDEMFADRFTDVGRRSVPPMIVALVMVLGRIEGCSDREAVDRFAFDVRWTYAAGGVDFDYPGFVHTVGVDMRARLARSARPNRIVEVTLDAARAAGLVGRRRVLDSTPLYDAVATMDTRRPAAHPHRTITNSPQNRHQSPARDPTRNAFHSSLENARIGPKGSFESRTSTAAPVMATSTQLPPPLAVLFFHRRGPCW